MPYFLKGIGTAAGMSVTELLSSGLAVAIGLATPNFCITHRPDGFYPVPTDGWVKSLKA